MSKWITNWPSGGRRWGSCSAAMASQIVWEGRCGVRLVEDAYKVTRFVLVVPEYARTLAQRHPAVAMALKMQERMRSQEPGARSQKQAA